MSYRDFIQVTRQLSFVPDDRTAEAMVRSVISLLESRLSEDSSRKLSEVLPEPLNDLKMRDESLHMWSLQEAIGILSLQFNLTREQAIGLFRAIVHTAKEQAVSAPWAEIFEDLPRDWQARVKAA